MCILLSTCIGTLRGYAYKSSRDSNPRNGKNLVIILTLNFSHALVWLEPPKIRLVIKHRNDLAVLTNTDVSLDYFLKGLLIERSFFYYFWNVQSFWMFEFVVRVNSRCRVIIMLGLSLGWDDGLWWWFMIWCSDESRLVDANRFSCGLKWKCFCGDVKKIKAFYKSINYYLWTVLLSDWLIG